MPHFLYKTLLITVLTFAKLSEGHLFLKDGFVGIGIDLSKLGLAGKCPNSTEIQCPCGPQQKLFNITIPICSTTVRWKNHCIPCNGEEPEEICSRYRNCTKCNQDYCAKCPSGKYGRWCNKECTCRNNGVCDRDGKCICREGFEGTKCENRKGCSAPVPILAPLDVDLSPHDKPTRAEFTCPKGFLLRGSSVSNCLSDGNWSTVPPVCQKECPLLSAPSNGRLTFSDNDLIEGVSAEISCKDHHKLIGKNTLKCLEDGAWSSELPVCQPLSSCPDPGSVKHATRSPNLEQLFLEESEISFKCDDGYEQLGPEVLVCQQNGTWSNDPPECLKISTVVPICTTKGSEIINEVGVSVRIFCPPECAEKENSSIWGTSIYRSDSAVCKAAVHSAKLTNSGGPVSIINNGPYSHFTGSLANEVQSQSFADRDSSFRFDKVTENGKSQNKDCDDGLFRIGQMCVHISSSSRTFNEAKAICTNLGLILDLPSETAEKVQLADDLKRKVIFYVWGRNDAPSSIDDAMRNESTNNLTAREPLCAGFKLEHLLFKAEKRRCQSLANFVCLRESNVKNLAACADPGSLANGIDEPVGKIDGVYYVGSSIKFKCNSLHYLKGESSISCTSNGSWSHSKPTCIKVNACEEPPLPIAGFVTYLPPLKSNAAKRAAVYRSGVIGRRTGRLPAGLSAELPPDSVATSTPEPSQPVSLPSGFHKVGSRAMYDCESRYYTLIGSRTRRCEGEGRWSGRPPTCIPVCGRSDSPRSPFVVNGNVTDVGQWPWQAGISRFIPDDQTWFLMCGAALINERWLISAAHCVTYAGTVLTIDADKFQAYLGKYHRQDSRDDDGVQVRKVAEIHIHPDYDPGLFDADIALLQLESPAQLNSRVQPVCLPTEQTAKDHLDDGKKGVVTGWGLTENEEYAETLQQAVLPVVSHSRCEKDYADSDLPLTVTDRMFCAGYADGKSDACSGDSGGPMVFADDSSRERRWILEGIVSWGSPRGCGNPGQYGGFTTVSKFLDWIHLFV